MMPAHPMTDADFQAQADLHAMAEASDIEKDPSRLQRAKTFAEHERDRFAEVAAGLPGRPSKPFNGAVGNSRMGPK